MLLRNQQFQRIATNYLRMFVSLVLGVFLIRLLLQFGEGVYAVVALTISSIGVAEILKEGVRGATIPTMGMAYHSDDEKRFAKSYSSALVLSFLAACFAVAVLLIFAFFLDHFEFDKSLNNAALTLIYMRCLSTFVGICVSPILNLMLFTGRVGSYNFWLAMERVGEVAGAIYVFWFLSDAENALQLFWFGVLSSLGMIAAYIGATAQAIFPGKHLVPEIRNISSADIRNTFYKVRWNLAAVGSVNLYLRFDVFAVNLFFGVFGTVIFGIASQLASYVRILTMGLIFGLDALTSQHASAGDDAGRDKLVKLSRETFELQTIALLSVAVFVVFHAQYFIDLLFGDQLPQSVNSEAITKVFLLLMFGMIARGLSEGWMSILAGSGHIRDYALPVFIGALLNPILVVAACYTVQPDTGIQSVAIIFMVLNIIFHAGFLPVITARVLGVATKRLVEPALVPAAFAGLSSVIILVAHFFVAGNILQISVTLIILALGLGGLFLHRFQAFLLSNQ